MRTKIQKNHENICLIKKNVLPLQPLYHRNKVQNTSKESQSNGPFVYRLGRKIFILERGVRFPYGLQVKLE